MATRRSSPCRGFRQLFGFRPERVENSDVESAESDELVFWARKLIRREIQLAEAAIEIWASRPKEADQKACRQLLLQATFDGWLNVTNAVRRKLLKLLASPAFIHEKKRAREQSFGELDLIRQSRRRR